MADKSSAAQNKMGELYVDLGSVGGGALIKQLGAIGVGLFTAKKAADLFIKPVKQMWKETGANVLQLKKFSVALGTTFQELHRLRTYLSQKGLSEGLIDDLGSLQDKLYDITHGFAAMDTGMAIAMNRLGLNIADYNGSLESTIRMIKDANRAMNEKNFSSLERAQTYRQLHMSKEFAYAMQRGDFDLSDYKSITDEQVDKMLKFEEQKRKIKADWENILMEKGAEILPKMQPVLDSLAKNLPTFANALEHFIVAGIPVIERTVNILADTIGGASAIAGGKKIKLSEAQRKNAMKDAAKNVTKGTLGGMAAGAAVGSIVPGAGTVVGAAVGGLTGSLTAATVTVGKYANMQEVPSSQLKPILTPKQQQAYDEDNITAEYLKKSAPKETATGYAAPINFSEALKNLGYKPQQNETQFTSKNIQSDNPMDRAGIPSSEQNKIINNNVNNNITNNFKISSTDPDKAAQEVKNKFDEHDMALKFMQTYDYY